MNIEKLKMLRESRKLLQKQIAIDLGVSQECYSLYETGKREPDHQRLKQIADFFDVSIDYLLDHAPPDREKTIDLRGLSEEGKKIMLAQMDTVEKLENAKWGNQTLEKRLRKFTPGQSRT